MEDKNRKGIFQENRLELDPILVQVPQTQKLIIFDMLAQMKP